MEYKFYPDPISIEGYLYKTNALGNIITDNYTTIDLGSNCSYAINKNLKSQIENLATYSSSLKSYYGKDFITVGNVITRLEAMRDFGVKYCLLPYLMIEDDWNKTRSIQSSYFLLEFDNKEVKDKPSKNSIEFTFNLPAKNGEITTYEENSELNFKIFGSKNNFESIKGYISKVYSMETSYEKPIILESRFGGNIKKTNSSKNNAWSKNLLLVLRTPADGGDYDKADIYFKIPENLRNLRLYNIDSIINIYKSWSSFLGLVISNPITITGGIQASSKVLMGNSWVSFYSKSNGTTTPTGTVYPSYTLPSATDSNYFYYNTTPDKVVSINKWKVVISGNLTEKDPGATIQNISGDLTTTPVYRYKGKINLAGNDIPLSLNPVFNNYKENDSLGNIKRINNYLFEWYQGGKEGINEGDKFNLMIPSIDGWEFTGWKLADGSKINDLSSPTEWVYKKHNTITATWKPKEYTITYKLLVPIEEKGDTSGQVYQIGNSKYSEVCFVTSSDRKKVKEDSFISKYYPGQKCELNSLGLFNSLFLEGYEKLDPDTVFHVIKHGSLENTWLTEEESIRSNSWYKPGQIISSQDIKTLGDVTLALIATPHKYTLTYNKPVYLKENKEYDLVGVNYKEEGNSKFTILNSKSFLSNSDLIYNDVNDLYPISRGYKFDYNVVKGVSGEDYTGRKVEPYTIFEDITVKSYFKIARYKFRYYDYYYDTYEDSDEFYYNDLSCEDGSSYLLPKFKPNNVKIIPDSEFYRFDGWSNKNLGKAFLSDIMVNVENINYFYQKDGNTYLRIPQNSADKINIIDLKSDWTRFSGPKIYKSDGWHWPVNYQGNSERDEDGNYYDAIKVFDKEGWHQIIKVFIRDEEKWNDLNIKSPHTAYEEI